MNGVISSSHKLITTFTGRMSLLHLIPGQILPFVVSQDKNAVRSIYRAIAEPESIYGIGMRGLKTALPPSSRGCY